MSGQEESDNSDEYTDMAIPDDTAISVKIQMPESRLCSFTACSTVLEIKNELVEDGLAESEAKIVLK